MAQQDVIVVGAGVMGAATAYALASRGRKVTILERFEVGHSRGSSHGKSRVFRFSYAARSYVEMGIESLALWRDLEDRAGMTILQQTGGLDHGEEAEANAVALEACGVPFEWLPPADVAERWPQVRVEGEAPLLYSSDTGWLNADLTVQTFIRLAREQGAELVEGQQVQEISPTEDEVVVRTADGSWTGSSVVVTAGPWARELLLQLDIELPVLPIRQTAVFFRQREVTPIFVEWGGRPRYALPDPDLGLKTAEHVLEAPPDDPEETGGPNVESVARLSEWVARRFPTANPQPAKVETCFYTVTDDERFIIERHGRVVVGSPCSGHGFKFAPLMGRRIAALAEEVL